MFESTPSEAAGQCPDGAPPIIPDEPIPARDVGADNTAVETALSMLHEGLRPIAITPASAPVAGAGKRPIGSGWGLQKPTEASLRRTYAENPGAGVGLLLGIDGGVIDIDVDDPSLAASPLAQLFPDGLPPTRGWRSNGDRFHLLFQYDHRLANYGQSVIKGDVRADGTVVGNPHYRGLEIRIGTTDPAHPEQVQSVIPPSLRTDGMPRRWNGHHEILPLPESFFADLDRHAVAEPAVSTARINAPEDVHTPRTTTGGATYDRKAVMEAARPLIPALAKEWGLRLNGRENRKGWMECHAVDRPDATPSASLNATTGTYHDFGSNTSLTFLDLAVKLGAFPDREAARDGLGERLGLEPRPTIVIDWLEPGPVEVNLLPVPVLEPRMIPTPLRGWLADIAERIGCPVEYPTVGAIVALGSLVGRKLGIRPKRHDDFLVVPNLWGGIVGRPGQLKTPALAEPMRILERLAESARNEHELRQKVHKVDVLIGEARKSDLEAKIKECVKKGLGNLEALRSQLIGCDEPEAMPERRYVINDPTVEKLGELLVDNPNGLLVFRDELVGWLKNLDRAGRENDRSFYLESWNGKGSYTYDRIGRGTIRIAAACVSVLGGIQPGPLAAYLREASEGGAGDDGLVSRFQVLVYPDATDYRNVDRPPDAEARERAFAIFVALDALDPAAIGAEPDADDPERGIPFLRFDAEGQATFDEWREGLERKVRSSGEPVAIEAHLSKYRSLMPTLALVFHLIDGGDGGPAGPVTGRAALMAAAWCEFLEAHARRTYHVALEGDGRGTFELARRIRSGSVANPFTAHDVARRHWSNLSSPADVERAVSALEELGWVCPEVQDTGGRPKTVLHINPAVLPGQEGGAR